MRAVAAQGPPALRIALLTGGDDRPYAFGIAGALVGQGVQVDFIGSDALDAPELHAPPHIRFLNLRGDQREDVPFLRKAVRIVAYYARLIRYTCAPGPRLYHILWNNKFEALDRTLLMQLYRLRGKRVVMTVHNVNAARRDRRDTWLNRATLWIQYRLCHHLFVHTERMRDELLLAFGIAGTRVTVVPFGLNDTIPKTGITPQAARRRLGLPEDGRVLLQFGQIAPYKGLDLLAEAFAQLAPSDPRVVLVIAGKVKRGSEEYWDGVRRRLETAGVAGRVHQHVRFIPDDEVESYFAAADAVVLPYADIFQSGVPFLAFSFGRPVIATDVGSLREDVIDGQTGFICRPRDPAAFAGAVRSYFASDLFRDLEARQHEIRRLALERHSWSTVGRMTREVYVGLLAADAAPAERLVRVEDRMSTSSNVRAKP